MVRPTIFTLLCLLLAASSFAPAATIEQRGSSDWPTRNHMRFAVRVGAPSGVPVLQTEKLPPEFNPDSVRLFGPGSRDTIASKVEWRTPQVEVSWISRGPGSYYVYFDVGGAGETARLAAPAMVGTGDPITYGRAGVKGRLSVGLWAHPGGAGFRRRRQHRSGGLLRQRQLQRHLPFPQPRHQRETALRPRRVARERQGEPGGRRFQRRWSHGPGGDRRIL